MKLIKSLHEIICTKQQVQNRKFVEKSSPSRQDKIALIGKPHRKTLCTQTITSLLPENLIYPREIGESERRPILTYFPSFFFTCKRNLIKGKLSGWYRSTKWLSWSFRLVIIFIVHQYILYLIKFNWTISDYKFLVNQKCLDY